jgi:hypothetical protein
MPRNVNPIAFATGNPARPPHRPRAINLNPVAVTDLIRSLRSSQHAVATAAKVSPAHLSEAINDGKGLTLPAIYRLAAVLRCEPGTIAPTLTDRFIARRPGDAA